MHALRSLWMTLVRGRVRRPLPGERTELRAALLAVGYRDDEAAPGGGYVIARHYWRSLPGSDVVIADYLQIPYSLIAQAGLAAMTFEEVSYKAATSPIYSLPFPEIPQDPEAEAAPKPEQAPSVPEQQKVPPSATELKSQAILDAVIALPDHEVVREPTASPHVDAGPRASATIVHGIDLDQIAEARWALVVNTLEDSALLRALEPLLRWRAEQQGIRLPELTYRDGEDCGTWMSRHSDGFKQTLRDHWGQIPPVLLYRPDEDAAGWLGRHRTMQGAVDPRRGVPYYLALVGRPGPLNKDDWTAIPFEFQYDLDISWGVGRICFTGPDGQHRLEGYRRYAELLVQQERSPVPPRRHAVFFAPWDESLGMRHLFDHFVFPLTRGREESSGVGTRNGYQQSELLARAATKANLGRTLRGELKGGVPDLLVIGNRGISLPLQDNRIVMHNGAIICQDWSGAGTVQREHWFAAEDVPDGADLTGLIAFLFGSYGAGTPQRDNFAFDPNQDPPQIAPMACVAQFPQELLLRGALGVLGHVDQAWNMSFRDNRGSSVTVLEETIEHILTGRRLGRATEPINLRYAALGNQVSSIMLNLRFGSGGQRQTIPWDIDVLRRTRNDIRNYIVLGDPAVRLMPFIDSGPQ